VRSALLATVCVLAFLPSFASARQAPNKIISVPNTAKGFDTQYQKFVAGYWKAKEGERGAGFEQFAIPPPWFVDTFDADHRAEMVKAYLETFDDFVTSTAKRIEGTSPCPICAVELKTNLQNVISMNVGSVGLPRAQQFVVRYQSYKFYDRENPSKDGDRTWMDTFIYIDGAFRFYGKGGSTFLDPVRVRLADPCSNHQLGGKPLSQTAPEYSEEAKQQHLTGLVRLMVTVSPDGSVKAVKVEAGDPVLATAAKEAAIGWRYTPFTQCGKAVEMTTPEVVHFPPSDH
jgi:TonB family protein